MSMEKKREYTHEDMGALFSKIHINATADKIEGTFLQWVTVLPADCEVYVQFQSCFGCFVMCLQKYSFSEN